MHGAPDSREENDHWGFVARARKRGLRISIHTKARPVAATVLSLGVAFACWNRGPAPLLPAALGEWTAAGGSQQFAGDELFMYINGGAAIYHEYGFHQLEVCEYRRGSDRISVEVYTMSGDAFGIYTFARSDRGEATALGNGGTLADYYLHFWSGPHLVVVTAQNEFDASRDAVLSIGRQIGERFPAVGSIAPLVDQLPTTGRVEGSLKHLAGPIALNNIAPLIAPLFAGFDQGAAARFREEGGGASQLVILRWSGEHGAEAAMEEALRRVSSTDGLVVESAGEGRWRMRYQSGEAADAELDGELVRLTVTGDGDSMLAGENGEVTHEHERERTVEP